VGTFRLLIDHDILVQVHMVRPPCDQVMEYDKHSSIVAESIR
jgi:hypothetical protein